MQPLRIAINIDVLFGPVPGGQGRVIINLIKSLGEIDQINQYTLFTLRPILHMPDELQKLPSNFRVIQLPVKNPRLIFLLWHTIRRPYLDQTNLLGQQDIIHATTPGILPAHKHAKLVLTVYDLVCWRFPKGLNFWGRFFHRTGLTIGVREASAIATISTATQHDLFSHFQNGVEPSIVHTVPIASDIDASRRLSITKTETVLEKYHIHQPYIVNIGTLEPRKNIIRLLKAYAKLPPKLKDIYQLVIIGPYGWKMPSIEQVVNSLNIQDRVRWTGHISDEDMYTLLRGASCFIYPSLYEGFGLPILEAMHCEVPIITSNISSMPEVAGDSAILVDPTNVGDLTAALERILQDENLRSQLVEKGRRQREKFSFARMAQNYLDIYTKVGYS